MAAELVGGAFISSSIQLLLERITSPEVVDYLFRKHHPDFDGLLKKLKMMASSLMSVLDDAEQRQMRDDPGVEAWLDEVQEAVFDAEDALTEIKTRALHLEVEADEVRKNKRHKIFNLFATYRDSSERDVESKIKKALDRFEEIERQKVRLCLNDEKKKPRKRLASTSLVQESEVYGRRDDKARLVELLLSSGDEIHVVPIVGMGGVGKTTLAQAVFNDDEVVGHFEVKAWVCVSEEFDVCRVTRTILESVTEYRHVDAMDLNSLQVKLRERLEGKKFLIVLDDIWSESYLDWDTLRTPFKDGARGSRIVISTRSNKVAGMMGTVQSHIQLRELSDEASWLIFAKHVSDGIHFAESPELERIALDIVGKCKGLPLALKAAGGLLRSTSDVQDWESVSKSDIWELPSLQTEILPALRFSYYYLPSPLKRCFSYCSIFPKDYEFDRDELVLLWMAENLLQDLTRKKRMEEVGDEYFNELVSRSFFQRSRNTNRESFVMHDILVDLAKFISRNHCFSLHSDKAAIMPTAATATTKTRHFAYVSEQRDTYEMVNSVFGATHLRTFLPLKVGFNSTFPGDAMDGLFSELGCLRVLSLSGYENIRELPDSISDLRHLHYLNLSSTSICRLSNATSTLYNLQTLKLAYCRYLTNLPENFHRLINLRHLDVAGSGLQELPETLCLLCNLQTLKLSNCWSLTKLPGDFHCLTSLRNLSIESTGLAEFPAQLGKLKSLQNLSNFVVKQHNGPGIRELGGLSDLRGTLRIKNLNDWVRPEEALYARLRDKKCLEKIVFEWGHYHETDNPVREKDLLDNLMPSTNLKSLEIRRYKGTELPN